MALAELLVRMETCLGTSPRILVGDPGYHGFDDIDHHSMILRRLKNVVVGHLLVVRHSDDDVAEEDIGAGEEVAFDLN